MCGPSLTYPNPKPRHTERAGRVSFYPYYAGFSYGFASQVVRSMALGDDATVLDPWNGAGTTTQAVYDCGRAAVGFDINPVMAVVAKARLLESDVKDSLRVLGARIAQKAASLGTSAPAVDPLEAWFSKGAAATLRAVDHSIRFHLLEGADSVQAALARGGLSALAAFYYVALFRTTRDLLASFRTSNPTWLRVPASAPQRVRPSTSKVGRTFRTNVQAMARVLGQEAIPLAAARRRPSHVGVADSRRLPLETESIDAILSSPPYCTRLDYAVATRPELAILGHSEPAFRLLREAMMGTAAVSVSMPTRRPDWGSTCCRFLKGLESHKSKASKTYYLKTHLQYFDALFDSLGEVARVLKPGCPCVLVLQDSHYKELHNDLPSIASEMAGARGLQLKARRDFPVSSLIAATHQFTRNYRSRVSAVESVLCLEKPR